MGLNSWWMFALELIKKAFLACRKLGTKPVCVYYGLWFKDSCVCLHMCVSACILHSLFNPGPECADYQSLQWISSAGGGCGAAAHCPAPGHCGGKDTLAHTCTKLWRSKDYTWQLTFYLMLQFHNNDNENNNKKQMLQSASQDNKSKTNVAVINAIK